MNQALQDLNTLLSTMNVVDVLNDPVTQLKATVTANEHDVKDLKPYTMDVAFDLLMLMPDKLSELFMRDERKNMEYINIIPMSKSNAFALGVPLTVAKALLANEHTTIECEDGNTIQLAFQRADDASAAPTGSIFWCTITIGAFDPTDPTSVKHHADAHLADLGFVITRFKKILHKAAGTWTKKIHVDLKIPSEKSVDPSMLRLTDINMALGMKASINWGKQMRDHFKICKGQCARVIRYDDWGERINTNSNCMCVRHSGGKSKIEQRAEANDQWARHIARKKARGGPSGTTQ
jgi:hypothetical protein